MPAVAEARAMLCAVPIDISRGESKGVWLARVSRLHGIAPALGKRIYYRERKTIDADVFNRMKSLNQRIESAKAATQAAKDHANAIRMEMGSGRRVVDVEPTHEVRGEMEPTRRVVPGSTDQ